MHLMVSFPEIRQVDDYSTGQVGDSGQVSEFSNQELTISGLSRRDFHQRTLGSLLTFSLLESLFGHQAFQEPVREVTAKWLAELNARAQDVKDRKLTQIEWQERLAHGLIKARRLSHKDAYQKFG